MSYESNDSLYDRPDEFPNPEPKELERRLNERAEDFRAAFGDDIWTSVVGHLADQGFLPPADAEELPPIEDMFDGPLLEDAGPEPQLSQEDLPEPPAESMAPHPPLPETTGITDPEEMRQASELPPFPDMDERLYEPGPAGGPAVHRVTATFDQDGNPAITDQFKPDPKATTLEGMAMETSQAYHDMAHSMLVHQQNAMMLSDNIVDEMEMLNGRAAQLRRRVEDQAAAYHRTY